MKIKELSSKEVDLTRTYPSVSAWKEGLDIKGYWKAADTLVLNDGAYDVAIYVPFLEEVLVNLDRPKTFGLKDYLKKAVHK